MSSRPRVRRSTMHTSLPEPTAYHPSHGGGRCSSPQYRHSLSYSHEFIGVPDDFDRYELLRLCKRVGKAAGLTPRLLQLLEYYLGFTRPQDFASGNAVCYQSLARTALELGVSERQIQHLEQQGFQLGLWTWRASGNNRRFGQRDKEGNLLFAYGIDLLPLVTLREELEAKLQAKQRHDDAWVKTKRQISAFRGHIRSLFQEAFQQGHWNEQWDEWQAAYNGMAIPIRTYHELATLESLLARHKSLYETILVVVDAGNVEEGAEALTENTSPRREKNFASINYFTQELTDKSACSPAGQGLQESPGEPSQPPSPIAASGLQHISLGLTLQIVSERFAVYLPSSSQRVTWPDVIEAAYRLRPTLGISQDNWAEACQLLGRSGAAICVAIVDRSALRIDNRVVHPGSYFRAMIAKARGGELRLHRSVFGLLEREEGPATALLPRSA